MAAKRRPGKYDHVIPKLPKWTDTSPNQERVEAMKVELMKCQQCKELSAELKSGCPYCAGTSKRTFDASQMGAEYVIARAMEEDLKAQVVAAHLVVKALTQMLVQSEENKEPEWGAFGAADNALRLTNGDGLRAQAEIYPSVSNKAEFRQWCYKNNLADKMELPPSLLEKLAKERLLNGLPDAPGTKVFVETKIIYSPLKTETVAESQTEETTADVF